MEEKIKPNAIADIRKVMTGMLNDIVENELNPQEKIDKKKIIRNGAIKHSTNNVPNIGHLRKYLS